MYQAKEISKKYTKIKIIQHKTGFYLELLISEAIKLFLSIEIKTTRDKNGEKILRLEISEVILADCILVNNTYQQKSRVVDTYLLPVNHLANY